jgi:hypothetical protein
LRDQGREAQRRRILAELTSHEDAKVGVRRARREEDRRRDAEDDRFRHELSELLLRARDAGITDSEIADALNRAHPRPHRTLWAGDPYTTQSVTQRMAAAERDAGRAVRRFTEEVRIQALMDEQGVSETEAFEAVHEADARQWHEEFETDKALVKALRKAAQSVPNRSGQAGRLSKWDAREFLGAARRVKAGKWSNPRALRTVSGTPSAVNNGETWTETVFGYAARFANGQEVEP